MEVLMQFLNQAYGFGVFSGFGLGAMAVLGIQWLLKYSDTLDLRKKQRDIAEYEYQKLPSTRRK